VLEFLASAKLAEDGIRTNAVGFTRKLDAEIDGGQICGSTIVAPTRPSLPTTATSNAWPSSVSACHDIRPLTGKYACGHCAGLEEQAILRERHAVDVRAQPFLGGAGSPTSRRLTSPEGRWEGTAAASWPHRRQFTDHVSEVGKTYVKISTKSQLIEEIKSVKVRRRGRREGESIEDVSTTTRFWVITTRTLRRLRLRRRSSRAPQVPGAPIESRPRSDW